MNKLILILFFIVAAANTGHAQLLEDRKFHEASNYYVNNDLNNALNTVKEGLRQKPGDQKLEDLRKLLEKEKEKQKKEQEKKDQEKKEQEKQQKDQKKDQDKKDQEKKDQEKKDQENKDDKNKDQNKDQQKKDQDKKDQEQKDKDKEKKEQDKKEGKDQEQKDQEENKEQDKKEVPPEVAKRLEQMKISEDKARMILEAMKNQETQYLQQNKRKATKSKDRTKPDW
jgi:hypothetical protein